MYCSKCGEVIDDEAVICPKCGCETGVKTITTNDTQDVDCEKTGVGVLCGLFLGLIGLIIGLCLYKEGTIARKSFIKAWAISFVVSIVLAIIIYSVIINQAVNAYEDTLDDYYRELDNLYNTY